jgi:ribosomal-protein-alanine N-acetyltransferase
MIRPRCRDEAFMNVAPESRVSIEPMTEAHLAQVVDIENEVFGDPWSAQSFLHEIRDDRISFARVALSYPEGVVVGYFVAWFIDTEVHLGNLAVAKTHRGRGIGQRLLDHLIETGEERQCTLVTLEVRETNLVAQRLYLKNGFRPVAIRKGYYPDNREDAIVMMRDV